MLLIVKKTAVVVAVGAVDCLGYVVTNRSRRRSSEEGALARRGRCAVVLLEMEEISVLTVLSRVFWIKVFFLSGIALYKSEKCTSYFIRTYSCNEDL